MPTSAIGQPVTKATLSFETLDDVFTDADRTRLPALATTSSTLRTSQRRRHVMASARP